MTNLVQKKKIESLLEKFPAPDIRIEEVSINIVQKKWVLKDICSYKDEEENKKNEVYNQKIINDLEKELETGNIIYLEDETRSYNSSIISFSHQGTLKLATLSKEEGDINLSIKITPAMAKMMLSMCIDSVCNICEEQTRNFQQMFLDSMNHSKEDIQQAASNLDDKIESRKDGLLKRLGIGKQND